MNTHTQSLLLARLGEQAPYREVPQSVSKPQVFGCSKAPEPRPDSYMQAETTCLLHWTYVNPGADKGKVKGLVAA